MLGLGNNLTHRNFVGGIDPAQAIINAFKTRVSADGGTFEAEQCLKDSLPALIENEPSLCVTPNAVEAGKLFSIIPTNGAGDLNVVRNTTATYVGADGLIQTALANIPRLDYTNGSCPSILVEPQRTNLVLRSEEFSSNSWAKSNSTVTDNVFISPSGELKADLITCTTELVTSNLNQTISVPSGSATLSIFAKAGNYNIFRIGNVSSLQRAAWFDLSTGSVIGTVNGGTASIKNYGNGWFRCIFTATSSVSGNDAFIISISSAANSTNGVLGANIYFWGAQFELGSNATSYIPTTTTSVTRNADVISKSGLTGITTITETFEDDTTNVISGSPTSYTMSEGRIKNVIGL